MSLPSPAVFKAAGRWVEALKHASRERAYRQFVDHHSNSDLTPTQYQSGYDWLHSVGLVSATGDIAPSCSRDQLLETALLSARPSWLADHDDNRYSPSDLPLDIVELANAVGASPETCARAVRTAHSKVDTELRSEIGLRGEMELVALLESECVTFDVDHVALESDGFGYDISLSDHSNAFHLEVKSTTRRGRLTFYISRHEHEVARSDNRWRLVVVFLVDNRIEALGTVDRTWLVTQAPGKLTSEVRWESARIAPPISAISTGLDFLDSHHPLIARGVVSTPRPDWLLH